MGYLLLPMMVNCWYLLMVNDDHFAVPFSLPGGGYPQGQNVPWDNGSRSTSGSQQMGGEDYAGTGSVPDFTKWDGRFVFQTWQLLALFHWVHGEQDAFDILQTITESCISHNFWILWILSILSLNHMAYVESSSPALLPSSGSRSVRSGRLWSSNLGPVEHRWHSMFAISRSYPSWFSQLAQLADCWQGRLDGWILAGNGICPTTRVTTLCTRQLHAASEVVNSHTLWRRSSAALGGWPRSMLWASDGVAWHIYLISSWWSHIVPHAAWFTMSRQYTHRYLLYMYVFIFMYMHMQCIRILFLEDFSMALSDCSIT